MSKIVRDDSLKKIIELQKGYIDEKVDDIKVKENDKYIEKTKEGIASKGIDEAIDTAKKEAKKYTDSVKSGLDTDIEKIREAQASDLAKITELSGKLNGINSVQEELNKKAPASAVETIEDKIPSQATSDNQLADKDFVNSSIATNTAEFKGTYNSLSELQKVPSDANDYGFVKEVDAQGNTVYNRYKYVEGEGWKFEYALNNSSFTAEQWAAINSKISATEVEKLKGLPYASEIATKNELDVVETLAESVNKGLGETIVRVDEIEKGIEADKAITPYPKDNEIIYTTIDGEIIEISSSNLISNIYYKDKDFGVVTFRDTLTACAAYFRNSSTLESIKLPDSITVLHMFSFSGCTNLKKIKLPNNLEEIGQNAFDSCINLDIDIFPSTIKTVKPYAFQYCYKLTKGIIPEGTTDLFAFYKHCTSLKEITIPNSVTIIRVESFINCSSLKSITIPASVTSIEASCFKGCTSLEKIAINAPITEIPTACFNNCKSLTSFAVPRTVTTIKNGAFEGCTSLTNLSLTYTAIFNNNCFYGCTSLFSLSLPDNTTTIDPYAFGGCYNLKYIKIPSKANITHWTSFECSPIYIDYSPSTINYSPTADMLEILILRHLGVVKDVDTYVSTFTLREGEALPEGAKLLPVKPVPLSLKEENDIMPMTNLDTYIGTPKNYLKIYVPINFLQLYKETYPTLKKHFLPITGDVPTDYYTKEESDTKYALETALQADKENLKNFKQHVEDDFVTDDAYNKDKEVLVGQIMSKQDSLKIVSASGTTLSAELNKYYRFDSAVNSLTVTLPKITNGSYTSGVILNFTTGESPAVTISATDGKEVSYFDGYEIAANTSYELNIMYNGQKWIVAYGTIK